MGGGINRKTTTDLPHPRRENNSSTHRQPNSSKYTPLLRTLGNRSRTSIVGRNVHIHQAHHIRRVDGSAGHRGNVLGRELGIVSVAAAVVHQVHSMIANAEFILACGLADVGDDSDNFAAGSKGEGDLVHANVAAEETISE